MRIHRAKASSGGASLRWVAWVALAMITIAGSGCRNTPYSEAEDYQDLGRFTYPGMSVGGGLTVSYEDFDVSGVSADDTSGFHLRVGARGSRYVAIEAVYERSNDFDTNPTSLQYTADAISVNFKVFPTGGFQGNGARLQPYLSAGGGLIFVDADVKGAIDNGIVDSNEFGGLFRYAAGLDFYLSESVLLSAEYARLMPTPSRLDDLEYDNINLGIQFRF